MNSQWFINGRKEDFYLFLHINELFSYTKGLSGSLFSGYLQYCQFARGDLKWVDEKVGVSFGRATGRCGPGWMRSFLGFQGVNRQCEGCCGQ